MSYQTYETVTRVAELISERRFDVDSGQWLVDYLEETHGYEFGAVLMLNQGLGRLEPKALSKQGRDKAFVEDDKLFVASSLGAGLSGITGWVARTGETVRSGDVRRDSRYHSLRDHIRSELCVPLKIQGRTIGVMNTETNQADAYNEEDERLLKTVAVLVAGWLTTKHNVAPDLTIACASCQKLRTEGTSWQPLANYLFDTFGTTVSHGLCPICAAAELKALRDDT